MPHRSVVSAFAVLALAGTIPASQSASAAPAGGRPVYVTNSAMEFGGVPPGGPPSVARFASSPAGALTPHGTVPAGDRVRGLVFTPDLRFAYTANASGSVSLYKVGPDGALTPNGAEPAPGAFGIAISPSGHHLYVGNVAGRDITVFGVQPNGSLLPAGTFDTGDEFVKGVAVTPDGRFLYVSHGRPDDTVARDLTGFALGANGLPVSQVASERHGISGAEAVITPDGRYVYVVCQASDEVFGYRIEPNGALTSLFGAGSGVAAGDFPEGAGISPDGRRLYVAAGGVVGPGGTPGQVLGFTIATDGTLTQNITPVTMTDPIGIGFAPDGRHVYVSDFWENLVNAFAVGASGDLILVDTEPSQGSRPAFDSVTVLPNKGPVAAFSARPAPAGYPTTFNASGSTDADGRVVRYDWSFGDGTVLRDGGPAPRHVYGAPGTYAVRVTVRADEGCPTTPVSTGQVASCAGPAAAPAARIITIT
ncbi:beta-propeller fold lactonase family protein [Micromonospora sp. CPCC 205371]|nr:beta-propeller fold lactonase family protein [Micromonospora sp. CPCC 205371]